MNKTWTELSSASSSSSASTSSSNNHKRKQWSRAQLLSNLSILGALNAPLPSTLPPSPPASRSSSPVHGSKRKADLEHEHNYSKRSRPGSISANPSSNLHTSSGYAAPFPHRPTGSVSSHGKRPETREDGELCEDTAPPPHDTSLSNVPIRRPKRAPPTARHYEELHDRYHAVGRRLKYSGDARFWSTYPPTHKEYRPLPDPPPPNSLYHKHGGLIARLELLDALLSFNYALWNKDHKNRNCYYFSWKTGEGFLKWCKAKWMGAHIHSEAEKAFVGLIFMMESFILARQAAYLAKKQLASQLDDVATQASKAVAEAIAAAEQKLGTESNSSLLGVKAESTPQMLPSPASIAPASSANSTPTSREGSTPSGTGDRIPAPILNPGPPIPTSLLPTQYQSGHAVPPHITAAANTVTVPFSPQLTGAVLDLHGYVKAAGLGISLSQQTLTLPIMARCFPRTFARMIHSTLTPQEEHEPDMEDEDCELLWPGQCINGEGIGWVCLMGQAMIREFGKPYGYKGLAGVVPKPEVIDDAGSPFTQGSVPHGATLAPRPRAHGATPGHTPPAFAQR